MGLAALGLKIIKTYKRKEERGHTPLKKCVFAKFTTRELIGKTRKRKLYNKNKKSEPPGVSLHVLSEKVINSGNL